MTLREDIKAEIDRLEAEDLEQVFDFLEELKQAKRTRKPKRPLPSRAALRASQPLAKTSSLEILQTLRDEARY